MEDNRRTKLIAGAAMLCMWALTVAVGIFRFDRYSDAPVESVQIEEKAVPLATSNVLMRTDARVLFISSYSYSWQTVRMQIDGILEGMDEKVTIDYEFMDTKRVTDEESMQLFRAGLKHRLEMVQPYDVVIVGDDAALHFVLEQREMFGDTPIIFEGVNDEALAREASEDPLITGVIEKLSLENNIDFAKTLIPNAKRVVAILDDSVTGQAERERFYSVADEYPEMEFSEINASALTQNEIKQELRKLNGDSILIYIVLTENKDGYRYSNQESVQMVAGIATVPVFVMVDGIGTGKGFLGGNVVSMEESGRIAAQFAMSIINGTDPGSIELVMESPTVYCVDETVMKQFKLDSGLLPEGTIVLNHQPDFFERNKEGLVPVSIVIMIMIGVIGWMFIDNLRRRRLTEELEKAHGIMESASQHDFLTGLSNRSKFMLDLEQLIRDKMPCTLMMIDVDDFKHINDTFGHTAGDQALQQIAGRLREMQSQILTPYRFAGDEFIIILRSTQSKIVEKAAYQCRQVFSKPCTLEGKKHNVGGSIGIAAYPDDTENLEQLIAYADDAMYQVKKNGKNDFAFYKKRD